MTIPLFYQILNNILSLFFTASKHIGFHLWGASDGTLYDLQELQDSYRRWKAIRKQSWDKWMLSAQFRWKRDQWHSKWAWTKRSRCDNHGSLQPRPVICLVWSLITRLVPNPSPCCVWFACASLSLSLKYCKRMCTREDGVHNGWCYLIFRCFSMFV